MSSVLASSTLLAAAPAITAESSSKNDSLAALLSSEVADSSNAEFLAPDRAGKMKVRFSDKGVELTHDLGGFESDASVDTAADLNLDSEVQTEAVTDLHLDSEVLVEAVTDLNLDSEVQVETVTELNLDSDADVKVGHSIESIEHLASRENADAVQSENAGDAKAELLESHAVDLDLGLSESSKQANDQEQTTESEDNNLVDERGSENAARDVSAISLIDIHLVDIAETEADTDTDTDTEIESVAETAAENLKHDYPNNGHKGVLDSEQPKLGLNKGNKAANDHAFKQILVSKRPTKNKPRYVENFTPQDLTKKGALSTTTAKVGVKSGEQSKSAENFNADKNSSAQKGEADATVVVITAPDLLEITEKRRQRPKPIQADANSTNQTEPTGEDQAKLEALRLAEENRELEEARLAQEARLFEEARQAEDAKQAEVVRLADEAKQAEALRVADEAKQAEALRLADEAKQAEAVRLAEEAKRAEEVRKVEAAKQAALVEEAQLAKQEKIVEAAAHAKAIMQTEAIVQTEIEALKVEADLAEAFGHLDHDLSMESQLTDESQFTGEFFADASVEGLAPGTDPVDSKGLEKIGAERDESDSSGSASSNFDSISSDDTSSSVTEASSGSDQSRLDGNKSAPTMASMLKTEHATESAQSVSNDHALAISNTGSEANPQEIVVVRDALTPVADASDLVTMAELYDSVEVDLDDTTNNGFGGLPNTDFSQPQGRFIRLWLSVRRTTRNLVDSSLDWLKRVRKK